MSTGKKMLWPIVVIATAALLISACGGAAPPPTQTAAPEEEHVEQESGQDHHDEEAEHSEEGEGDHMESEEMGHGEEEHQEAHMHGETPEEYEGLTNPFQGQDEAIQAGMEIFIINCATCHGETGQGDGPASPGLDPKPADLTDNSMMQSLSDGYLFWRIEEGGTMEPFNSAMPAWGDQLTEDQIWQVISYLRSLSE